jgi:serine/threonine protein kinase
MNTDFKNEEEEEGEGEDVFALEQLPETIMSHVFSFLPSTTVVNLMLTSKACKRAALSGLVFKSLCEKLAMVDDLQGLTEKAKREFGLTKKEEKGDYYRKVFIEMQKNPLMRYRFIRTIPTLGLNVEEHDDDGKVVFGGFSFNRPVADNDDDDKDDSDNSGEKRITGKKRTSNRAFKSSSSSLKNKEMSDYACFKVRESVEIRDSHRQRMWECYDVCSGTHKAVKLVGFLEKPEEGLRSRKLREASNVKALSAEHLPSNLSLGANSIARLERVVTVDEEMPFDVPWLVGTLPPEIVQVENEDIDDAIQNNRERSAPKITAKLLLIHEYFPISLRAQRSRVCNDPRVAEKQPPEDWCYAEDGRLRRSKVRMITQQLIEGVRFAHSIGITHRNLHCGHLLVDEKRNNNQGQLVIASWAASRGTRDCGKKSPLRSCTVPYYIAPEGLLMSDSFLNVDSDDDDEDNFVKKWLTKPKPYTQAVDLWACGCVFAEFILGASLFNKFAYYEGAEHLDQMLCIFKLLGTPNKKTWPDVVNIPGWHDDNMFPKWLPRFSFLNMTRANEVSIFQADLLRRLLTLDPARRITAEQALLHPYFTSEFEHTDNRTTIHDDDDDERVQRLRLPGGESVVQRHVFVKRLNKYGVVEKLEHSPCTNFHRFLIAFDEDECEYWSESDVLLHLVL